METISIILSVVAILLSGWALSRTFGKGQIKGNEIKNEKGDVIYRVED